MSVVIEERKGGFRIVGSGGGGKGGGGSARTPVEQPDSLHNTSYAALLDIIGNGEMAGPVHASSPLQDIFLDGTPIQNADGTLNFRTVQVEYRTGTQNQSHIPGFPASANVTSVGVEVKTAQPWVQSLTNPELSAVRVSIHAPQLMRMIESGSNAGDRVGYKVEYAIDLAVDGGSYAQVIRTSLDGKTVNGYTRTHRVELPSGAINWTVRVRRITPEATNSSISDAIAVQSYAEVIDGKFRYPMTALVGIKVDAEQFQSIPTRAYRWRGQIIRVPSNYDPVSRTYSGVWDGTFKRAWSNNPAWVYFDILTSKLYGLGDRIDASMIDRYALYQIGAYCDQMVPDGMGGTEPRFTCNVYLQSAADALRVLNDLTSTFRGMAYWANGQVVAVADAPSDPVYTYTNANVIDGRFEYTGADLSTLKTVALVSWNDPTDFYRAKVEVVNDDDGIRRYGIRKTEIVAFGCSSRGQAQRVGLYHLYTSRMETGGVTFSVGLDGVIPQPGSIVKIADRNRAGRHIGGRIRQATASTVTLDRDHPIKVGDALTVNLPDGTTQSRNVSLVSDRVITVSPAFSQAPTAQAVWAVDADDLVTQHVRVVSVKDEGGITYAVSGIFHHPDKFNAIDNGVRLDPLPVSVVPPRVQRAPTNIQVTQHHTFHQGTTRHFAEISWDAPEYAASYDVQWRRDNGDWVQMPRTGTRLVEIPDIYAGLYVVRVRAINALDVPSLWGYSDATELDGLIGEPPALVGISTQSIPWGIVANWQFPNTPNIIERTEFRYSTTTSFGDSLPLGEYSYPTNTLTQNSLKPGAEHYYWARLIDKNGERGPWFPAETEAGVRGVTSTDATGYSELITQQILESALGEQLWDGIEAMPDLIDTTIPDIQAKLDQLEGAEEWDPAQAYLSGSVVFADGKMYRALQDVPEQTPITNQSYWQYIGDYDSVMGAIAALSLQTEENLQSIEDIDGAVATVATATSTMLGVYRDDNDGDPLADVLNEWDSRVWITETRRIITSDKQAQAEINLQLGAQIGDNTAVIDEIQTVIATDKLAQAQINQQLQSGVADNLSAIQTIQQTIVDDKTAQAAINQQLQSDLTGLDGLVQGQAIAIDDLETLVEEVDGVVQSTAQRTNTLVASRRDDYDEDPLADVLNEWESRAWIQQLERTQVTETQVEAIVQQQVGVELGEVSAIVEDLSHAIADIDGNASAMRTIKVGINSGGTQYMAGLGVGIENDSGVVQSQIVAIADRFAVMHAVNGTPVNVFSVEGGTSILNSAIIGDASIGFAKIQNDIQSSNYVSNQTGWRLDKNGNFQLNGPGGTGRLEITNTLIRVYDSNNRLRVRLGLW